MHSDVIYAFHRNRISADNYGKGFVQIRLYIPFFVKYNLHNRLYMLDEWRQLAETAGFTFHDSFETQIRFPRKMDAAFGLECIMKSFDKKTISGYDIEILQDEIWITEKVQNVMFLK